jgi:hypothetical protein
MQARWKVLADGGSPVSARWLKIKVFARFDNWGIMLIFYGRIKDMRLGVCPKMGELQKKLRPC